MTVRDVAYFTKLFEKQIKFNKRYERSNTGYGENVMPVLNAYAGLSEFSEREAFLNTLVKYLESPEAEKREFAVNLCLGFFIFRDAIGS